MLLAWERATGDDRQALEKMILDWQPQNWAAVNELLLRYETFQPSLELIAQYLARARQALAILPGSSGRDRLLALADFLTQQTGTLTVGR